MRGSILHIAPHSHPYRETFNGRFGGQSLVMRRLLEDQPGGFDHHVLVLSSGQGDVAQSPERISRLHLVGDCEGELDGSIRRQVHQIAQYAVALCARLPDLETVCFHYRDGAAVHSAFSPNAGFKTAFVSHSLQLAHREIGGRADSALDDRISVERRALETCDLAVFMSRYEASLIAEAGYAVSKQFCLSDRIALKRSPGSVRIGNPVHILFGGRPDARKNLAGFGAVLTDLARSGSLKNVEVTGPIGRGFGLPVRPLGFLPHADFLHEMQSADLVVLPSLYEPFGLVWLEGLLSGAHVLAPHLSAAADMEPDPFLHLADFRMRESAESGLLGALEALRAIGRGKRRGDPAIAPGILAEEITHAISNDQ